MDRIIIDYDPALQYETNSVSRKFLNSLLVPILNILPASIQPLLRKSHKSGDDIIKHATTHKALEVLYGYSDSSRAKAKPIQHFFRSIWLSTNNSKAVRNRLKLVKKEIMEEIESLSGNNKEIKILSIASGSARAVLESIDQIPFNRDIRLSATFVDKNRDAILYSQKLADIHKYRALFEWVEDTASNYFRKHSNGKTFNIVEIVGLIDYFNDEKAKSIFSQIYNVLDSDGILITANISDNSERPFVTKAVGWNMVYRSAEELVSVLEASGFSRERMKVFYEPQKIHCVVVARK